AILTSSSAHRLVPSHLGLTSTNKELWTEVESLSKRVEYLESEIELYKNLDTSPLR
ncbi:22638_t:CDS:1, partial [Gigaspora margarita]